MYHIYADDGRIITPPKELEPLLKGAFPAFFKMLGHIRFFYMADEIWDGKSSLIFSASGKQIASILLGDGSFNIHIAEEIFRIADESSLSAIFDKLEKTALNYRRPSEQLTINPNGFPCGYRCDMCILNKSNNENDNMAGDEFGYLSWLCYHNGLGESVERYDSKGHHCPGCEEVRKSNPKYCRYINCATEKGHKNCVECGSHNTCHELKDSHPPGQCNLGLTADEVTKMIIPYYMKWRLDVWRRDKDVK
jgi:hypothetical protein